MVHTNSEQRTGLLALDALTRHGVDPARVVIAHAGDSNDLHYLRTIAQAGASLGCDRFGIEHFNPLPDRIRTLMRSWPRATRTASTSATTPPASSTSSSATRSSPRRGRATC